MSTARSGISPIGPVTRWMFAGTKVATLTSRSKVRSTDEIDSDVDIAHEISGGHVADVEDRRRNVLGRAGAAESGRGNARRFRRHVMVFVVEWMGPGQDEGRSRIVEGELERFAVFGIGH